MPKRASLILINEHREVLLIERVKGDRHYWVFPGGSVEDGEILSEAAKREALEETSIEADIAHTCVSDSKSRPKGSLLLIPYRLSHPYAR